MSEIADTDFRQPRRYVRLDTILRLRWLAVLGQMATIFVVSEGLDFEVPVIPCIVIIGLSSALNLALQTAFNPVHRLEPRYAAALLAINIAELAGAAGPHRRVAESIFISFPGAGADFRDCAADADHAGAWYIRGSLRHGTGFFHMPLPWNGDEPLVLPRTYMIAVWISIVLALGVTSLYAFQVTEEARKLSDALAATELVLTLEQHLTQIDGLAAAAAHELGTPLSTIFLISRELEQAIQTNGFDDHARSDLKRCASRRSAAGKFWRRSPSSRRRAHRSTRCRCRH